MIFRLTVRHEAELEMVEAAEYYENERPGLGLEFLDALEEVKHKLTHQPQFYFNTAPEEAQRRYLMARFHYAVVYEVKQDEVVVIAVRHARRKPLA